MAQKFDPNKEAFQMRAQWKKQDNCRMQWSERWNWLLDEGRERCAQAEAIRREATDALPQAVAKSEDKKSLKPVPQTSTGVVGWISTRPDCQLEIYTSWTLKPPIRLPDAWENPNYSGPKN